MADQLKQHQKSALQLLETAAFHIKSSDKAVSVLAALVHVWLHRRVLVSAELILPSITNALEARVPVTSGWLSDSASALPVLELTDALITPEQAVGDWLTKIGTGGAKGPLGRGLALADADLLREVFPPALERQRLVDKLVLAAGRPTAPAQAAIVNVLSYIWAENIDNVQVRVLHAMARPDYTNWLVSDLKSDVQTVATYFSTKIAGLAASDKVKPADAQAALETATSALLDHIRAVSAASATPPTVVAAVAAPTAPAPTQLEPGVKQIETLVAAMTTAMDRLQYSIQQQQQQQQRYGSSSSTARGGRGGGRGARSGRGASRGRGGGGRQGGERLCYTCGNPGHLSKDCAMNDNSYYVGALAPAAAAPDWHWRPPQQLRKEVLAGARRTAEHHEVSAFVDTGSGISAVDEEWARRRGCIIKPYTGPPLATVTGAPVAVIGQTSLSVRVDEFESVLAPVAVIRQLAWPLLLGMQDLQRAGALHVDFSVSPARVRLGQLPARLAALRARPVHEIEGTPELFVASRLARDVDEARRAKEAADRGHAVPLPPFLTATRQELLQPAIDYFSEKETLYREAYQFRNRLAFKQVKFGANLTAVQRAELEEIVAQYATVFADKGEDAREWKPPVLNSWLPGAGPLPYYLKPGVQVRSVAQPLHHTSTGNAILEKEADTYIRTGRGVHARRSFATATSFLTEGDRVVHSYIDANDMLLMTAHTLPSTDSIVRRFAAYDAKFYNYYDFREGFSQVPLAAGSGVAACIRIGSSIIEPYVATMGIHAVPGEFNRMMSQIFSMRPADYQQQPALHDTMLETYIDDSGQPCRSWAATKAGLHFFLGRARLYGITLTAPKCVFGADTMVFCGNEIKGCRRVSQPCF